MEKQPSILLEWRLSNNRIIRGDMYIAKAGPSKGKLLLFHGYKGFKDWGMFPHVASELADVVDVIALNFSYNGVGENLLEFTELDKFARDTYTRDLEDIGAVMDELRQNDATRQPVILLGHSRGAAVSLIYGLDHPDDIAGVISWNGIANVDLLTADNKAEMRANGRTYTLNGRTKQMMPLDLEILEDMERNQERFDIVTRISDATFPITLIQGTEDGERGVRGSTMLVASNPAISWVRIPGGNHTFGSVHPFQGSTQALDAAIQETKRAIHAMLRG